MEKRDVLKLTMEDRASIARWRRIMLAAVAVTVGLTVAGSDPRQRYLDPLLEVTMASAQSRAATVSRECAVRDAQYLWQMEDRGELPGASGEKLHQAHLAMLEARTLCETGRQKDAMALYDQAFGPFVSPKTLATMRDRTN